MFLDALFHPSRYLFCVVSSQLFREARRVASLSVFSKSTIEIRPGISSLVRRKKVLSLKVSSLLSCVLSFSSLFVSTESLTVPTDLSSLVFPRPVPYPFLLHLFPQPRSLTFFRELPFSYPKPETRQQLHWE